jgi:hydroxycarboxylate dehydrogenase B
MTISVSASALQNSVAALFEKCGSNATEAQLVANNLVEANLRGHDSHGVGMVPRYVDAVLEGGLQPNAKVSIKLDSGTLLTLDGQQGFGQVIGQQAMQMAIDRAQQHGICLMGLAHSHHLGRIGHWAEQAVAANMVSIHFVNVISRALVAPFGARDARFGTNPLAIGLPVEGHEPFILDLATSGVAQGKLRVAHNQGKAIAAGLLIDDQGNPTTDPRYAVIEPLGAMMTFGEHKGYGIAMACELLGAALAGGLTYRESSNTATAKVANPRRVLNSMLTIVIDPRKLGTAQNFLSETRAFVEAVKSARPANGVAAVQIAGDPERAFRQHRLVNGIQIDPTTWQEIMSAGLKVGLPSATWDAALAISQ